MQLPEGLRGLYPWFLQSTSLRVRLCSSLFVVCGKCPNGVTWSCDHISGRVWWLNFSQPHKPLTAAETIWSIFKDSHHLQWRLYSSSLLPTPSSDKDTAAVMWSPVKLTPLTWTSGTVLLPAQSGLNPPPETRQTARCELNPLLCQR